MKKDSSAGVTQKGNPTLTERRKIFSLSFCVRTFFTLLAQYAGVALHDPFIPYSCAQFNIVLLIVRQMQVSPVIKIGFNNQIP